MAALGLTFQEHLGWEGTLKTFLLPTLLSWAGILAWSRASVHCGDLWGRRWCSVFESTLPEGLRTGRGGCCERGVMPWWSPGKCLCPCALMQE